MLFILSLLLVSLDHPISILNFFIFFAAWPMPQRSQKEGADASPVPRSADRSMIKRRSIKSVSAAIFPNPGEAKKRPCKTHARWSAKIKAETGKEVPVASGETVSAESGKLPHPKHGRRGSKKFRRRFFSQNVAGASSSNGGVMRRGPRRLSGSNNAPFNSTQFLMNDRGSESIRYLDDKLVRIS
jgi:hypothetical protein